MAELGLLVFFLGMLALAFTGIISVRRQSALAEELKNELPEIWCQLGKPELSVLNPFSSLALNELVFSKQPDLRGNEKLIHKHLEARSAFFLFGANFGFVFLGVILIGASSGLAP